MKAPDGTPSADDVRKAARRVADGEAEPVVRLWPNFTPGERNSLRSIMIEYLGLDRAHRQRRYFVNLMKTAMAAYDLRMESRQRSLERAEGR